MMSSTKSEVNNIIATTPKKHRATAIGNIHENFGKDRAGDSGDIFAHRQTHKHTDTLITILRNRSRGQSNKEILPGSQRT